MTINKQVMVGLGRFVLAETIAVGTQLTVSKHLDNMDDIHDEICGTETSAFKMIGNSIVGTASGWLAGLVTYVITDAIIK